MTVWGFFQPGILIFGALMWIDIVFRNAVISLLIIELFCSFSFCFAQNVLKKRIEVAIIMDCDRERLQLMKSSIIEETEKLLKNEYDIHFNVVAYAGCTRDSIQVLLNKYLSDPTIDLVVGIGQITSQFMAQHGPYSKPVFATEVFLSDYAKIPITAQRTSGMKNLSYIVSLISPRRSLEVFYKAYPFKHLAIIIDRSTLESFPFIQRYAEQIFTDYRTSFEFIPADSLADPVINQLGENYDAVWITAIDGFREKEKKKLYKGIIAKKLPSFSIEGEKAVREGALLGLAPENLYLRYSRRTAINIQTVLKGELPENLGVDLSTSEKLLVNAATASQIDFSLPWSFLLESEIIDEEKVKFDREVDLYQVISEGLQENLEIQIAKKRVDRSEKFINFFSSFFYPQVFLLSPHLLIGTNNQPLRTNPQRIGFLLLVVEQVVYNEAILAAHRIVKHLSEASRQTLTGEQLDYILIVTEAYIDVLMAKTIASVQKENFELTQENLELAKGRISIGYSSKADLYRWEGELAKAKSYLLTARQGLESAKYELNRLLNRPPTETFFTKEVDLFDPKLFDPSSIQLGKRFTSNPERLGKFGDFLLLEAMARQPRLKRLHEQILAVERFRKFVIRTYFLPSVFLLGSLNYNIYRRGGLVSSQGEFILSPVAVPQAKLIWFVGATAEIPIFTGGRRNATVQASEISLSILNQRKQQAELQIDADIRTNLINTLSALTNIQYTKEAKEAAVNNLELVQDSYAQGQVSIVQLIDAQQEAITAMERYANATNRYYKEIFRLERSAGFYTLLMTKEERVGFNQRLIQFFADDSK
ncbi:TolC family protein [Xanthovirga aplysinae]|uniref:TolC family protein n=1 Tax=Xanthovirga aplysinae TaxID=2529853 RepID=UPI0012BCC865|nr:TolC family protein [Xanthovirga aplysinae]MTI33179.1 TolC family protein [Xanthovirga aplysinae]